VSASSSGEERFRIIGSPALNITEPAADAGGHTAELIRWPPILSGNSIYLGDVKPLGTRLLLANKNGENNEKSKNHCYEFCFRFDFLVMAISCSSNDIAADFTQYNSMDSDWSEDINSNFLVKHPPDWEVDWVPMEGVLALLISSDGQPWSVHDNSETFLTILPDAISAPEGIRLDRFPFNLVGDEIIEELATIKINGQDAAKAVYREGDGVHIFVLIVNDVSSLYIIGSSSVDNDAENRPILEAIIDTIELQKTDN